jgi:hypothetical protein
MMWDLRSETCPDTNSLAKSRTKEVVGGLHVRSTCVTDYG